MVSEKYPTGRGVARGSSGSDGKFTCQQGTWVLSDPGSCVIQQCETGGAFASMSCRASATLPYTKPTADPTYGSQCQVTCDNGAQVIQQCNVSTADPNGLPVMMAVGASSCPTTTTTQPATTSTTAAATTSAAKGRTVITHSVAFSQDFKDTDTDDSLMKDTAFTKSVSTGLKSGVEAGIPALKGKLDDDSILLNAFKLGDPSRRLAGESRRLAVKKLDVNYGIVVPSGVSTSADDMGASLVANKGAFESSMAASYAAAYEANTGSAPPGFTGVTASDEVGVKVETVAPVGTPAPAPPPPSPPVGPAPVPSPAAPSAPGSKAEEEDDNTGMIVGIVVGVIAGAGILGGVFYMYKKKKAAE